MDSDELKFSNAKNSISQALMQFRFQNHIRRGQSGGAIGKVSACKC